MTMSFILLTFLFGFLSASANRETREIRELLKEMGKIQHGLAEIDRKVEKLQADAKEKTESMLAMSTFEDTGMLSAEMSDSSFPTKSRLRREAKSLVEIMLSNSKNLKKLVDTMDTLVNSTVSRELLDPFFVSAFVLLSDITFSTSPRIDKHREEIDKLSKYYRENIMGQGDLEMFDEKMNDVIKWYTGSAELNSCIDALKHGGTVNGLYKVRNITNTDSTVEMYCDQETGGGGWTVVLRRHDGSENFDRTWNEFKTGFGNKSSEFWIGNEILHALTSSEPQELRVDLEDFDGNTAHATYSSFAVASEDDCYRLSLSGYSGDAGDAMTASSSSHNTNGQCFSTRDNDRDKYSGNCATGWKGAWWWNSCGYLNLNAPYFDHKQSSSTSLSWYSWKNRSGNLKKAEMKIRSNV